MLSQKPTTLCSGLFVFVVTNCDHKCSTSTTNICPDIRISLYVLICRHFANLCRFSVLANCDGSLAICLSRLPNKIRQSVLAVPGKCSTFLATLEVQPPIQFCQIFGKKLTPKRHCISCFRPSQDCYNVVLYCYTGSVTTLSPYGDTIVM